MKLRITFAAVAALALVVVAAAFAGSDGKAAKAARGSAAIACGTTRTIGVAAPLTGPAASIGTQQLRWAQYYVKRWNAVKANAKQKIAIVQGDTQLGVDTAFAVKVAQSFASNPKVLGVVGPAGSQEVVASTSALKGAGLGFVSGSASRVSLTDGHTDGVNRQGYFFRTVPNDNVQGPTVANYIRLKLKAQRVVIIDDQEVYSQGLSDTVQANLRAKGITVTRESVSQDTTDFSSLIAKIPGNTNVIYIPWQLSPRAQAFGQQLKAAGKSITLFGSDGLFDPATWKITGSLRLLLPGRHERRGREGVYGRPRRRRRVLRRSDLRGDPGGRQRDHEGVQGRQGDPRGGAQEHRPDEHPGPTVGARVPRSSTRRTASSATAGTASSRSSPTARTSASGNAPARSERRAAHHRMGRTPSMKGLRAWE